MARQDSPRRRGEPDPPRSDPWAAVGYLVAGVALYGLAGWGLDQWWGTSFMVAVGIVLGAVLGIYLTFLKFQAADPGSTSKTGTTKTSGTRDTK